MAYKHPMQINSEFNDSSVLDDRHLLVGRTIDELLVEGQARQIHGELLPTIATGIFTAVMILSVFAQDVSGIYDAIFLSILFALGGGCFILWTRFRLASYTLSQAKSLLYWASFYFAVTGAVWAFAIYVFFPAEHYPQRLALLSALLVSGTASVFSLGAYFPAFVAAIVPMGLIVVALLMLHGPLADPVLATSVIFIPIILAIAVRFNALLLAGLKSSLQNSELVVELTRQRNRANEATLAKSIFLAKANHDLRQPMHALSLYLDVLSEHTLPAGALPVVANMKLCATAMDDLFKALLDIWRLDSGTTAVQKTTFPLMMVFDQVQAEFAPQALALGLNLRVVPCSFWTHSDPTLLGQIVRNLMSNAIRYTPQGTVLIGCRHFSGGLRLQVWDTGVGIALEHQGKIFDEFYQVSKSGGNHSRGLGLGLAIVQRLATALDSPLSLRSAQGQGSTFSIDLLKMPPERPTSPVKNAKVEAKSVHGRKPLVVIIDDDRQVLRATQLVLEQAGFSVIAAGSGDAAIALLSDVACAPVAIVCDHRLGDGMEGQEVIAAICEEFNTSIPAMIITGDTSPELLGKLRDGGLPVLIKPVQAEALCTALSELISATDFQTHEF